jgi:hypothetical protein
MKMKRRFHKRVIVVLFTVILLAAILLTVVFLNCIKTIFSIKKINSRPVYQMTYYGDYALNQYMKHGAADPRELQAFLKDHLGKGAGNLFVGKHGCSAFFGRTPDGDLILARNFDTPKGEGCILKTDDTEGSRILVMSNVAWIMNQPKNSLTFTDKLKMFASPYVVTDGMNEYGLSVSLFTASGS